MIQIFHRILTIVRFRPHDISTEHGRSHERYRRMALTSIAAFGSRGTSLLASLISIPLTYRYLGPERYGLWMVLTSLIAVMAFADLGIGNGVINCVAEAHGKGDRILTREYVTSAFILLLGIAGILATTGAMAYPFIPWMRLFNVKSAAVASEGATGFLVLYYWFVVNIPLGVVTRVQAGLQEGYWSNLIGAGGNFLSLFGLALVVIFRGDLAWLVFASTFGSIVALTLNGWLLFRNHRWLIPTLHAFRKNSARKIFKLGLMFFVLQCGVAIGYSSDNIVITQVLGVSAVAVYAVPQKLFSFVSMLVAMGMGPIWPAYGEAISRGDVAWVGRVFWRSLRVIFLLAVPTCTFLVLTGPWIIRTAMGKTLQVPISLLITLGIWGIVVAMSIPASMLLNGAGAMKVQAIVTSVSSLANLALSIFLTRRLGVIGVCLGSTITQLTIVTPAYFVAIRSLLKHLQEKSIEIPLNQAIWENRES